MLPGGPISPGSPGGPLTPGGPIVPASPAVYAQILSFTGHNGSDNVSLIVHCHVIADVPGVTLHVPPL